MVIQDSTDFARQIIAVILAAGSGTRMGSETAKQFMDLCGRPLLAVTLNHFQRCNLVDRIVLVVPPEHIEYCRSEIVDRFTFNKVYKIVPGGERRQDSVRNGLEAINHPCNLVLIHDGVRPLMSNGLLERLIEAAQGCKAVITGLPVKESVKEVDSTARVLRSIDRRGVYLIQTPQIFRLGDIKLAHKKAVEHGWEDATDDAFLVEKLGIPVTIIQGEEDNIKVTTPRDLEIARLLLSKRSASSEE